MANAKYYYGDKEALEFLSKQCDAITYEFENIPVESLSFLNTDITINPSPYILSISQNRLNEKRNFTRCGISTPNFTSFNKGDDLVSVIEKSNINFPIHIIRFINLILQFKKTERQIMPSPVRQPSRLLVWGILCSPETGFHAPW